MTEFAYSDRDFKEVAARAYDIAGIVLGENKRSLVYSRIARRLRALKLKTFGEYLAYLKDHGEEQESFINAITTNLTKFFREAHHFDFLEQQAMGWRDSHRVWSAGCSTGEEPWSIVLTLAKANALSRTKVLATDIDTSVLAKASLGEYSLEDLDAQVLSPYRKFLQVNTQQGVMRVQPEMHDSVRFNQLNLKGEWPMKRHFDVIFCRNVMIYFDDETRVALAKRFIERLKPGGYLIIGHSESLNRFNLPIKPVGPTTYQVAHV